MCVCTDHLQLTLSRAKVEIEQATAEILNQQKYIATEVGLFADTSSALYCSLGIVHAGMAG